MWKKIVAAISWRINLWSARRNPDHYQNRPSRVVAAEIWNSRTNDRLLDIIYAAIPEARKIDHSDISAKMPGPPYWPDIWPGEKYKLLSALVVVLQPQIVVEIGTSTGLSAMSIKKHLPVSGRLYTFDLRPWNVVPNTVLAESDFADGRMLQITDDLSDKLMFENHADVLRNASIVFIDIGVDKLRREEKKILGNFETLNFKTNPIFILNDIRLDEMVTVWEGIRRPKQDVTSFGHWSGNGLVDWNG